MERRRRRTTKPERKPLGPDIEPEEGTFTEDECFRIAILLISYKSGIPFEQVFDSWTRDHLDDLIDRAARNSGREYWGMTVDGRFKKKPGRPRKYG